MTADNDHKLWLEMKTSGLRKRVMCIVTYIYIYINVVHGAGRDTRMCIPSQDLQHRSPWRSVISNDHSATGVGMDSFIVQQFLINELEAKILTKCRKWTELAYLYLLGYVALSKYLATVGDCTVRLPTCSKQKRAQKATTQLLNGKRCQICTTRSVGQTKLPSKHQPCVTVWCISSATGARENTPPEKVNFALQLTQTRCFASRFGLAKRHGWAGKQKGLGSIPLWLSRLFKSSLALLLSTWLNLFRSTSLLGLCALLQTIESFASPSSKENSMVVVPFASLLSKSGILFLSLSITALPSPPSNLALKLTSSNSILTSNGFSAAQIGISISF